MDAPSSIVAVIMTLIIAAGCQVGGPNWVGEWQGRVPLDSSEPIPEDIRNTLDRVNIIIRENGTFSMVLHGLPIEGNWTAKQGEVTLSPKRVLDRPTEQLGESMRNLAKPYVLRDESGKVASDSFGSGKTVLTKVNPNARPR